MKLVKTIIAATIMFWAVHFLLFAILFGGWFFRFVLEWFVGLGSPQPETSFESSLRAAIKVLLYPVRLFFADGQFDHSVLSMFFLFGISSMIWGGLLGSFIYAIRVIRRRTTAA